MSKAKEITMEDIFDEIIYALDCLGLGSPTRMYKGAILRMVSPALKDKVNMQFVARVIDSITVDSKYIDD